MLFFPCFFNALLWDCRTGKSAFCYGFLTSLVIMLGGFYWVVYVIHVFGYLPWWISVLLYLGFCGFGALNFPLFAALGNKLCRRFFSGANPGYRLELWVALGLPALFTIIEFFTPKLFPWYVGHCLYRSPWANQIVDIAGSEFLTFVLYSVGSVLGFFILKPTSAPRLKAWTITIPAGLLTVCLAYSAWVLRQPPVPSTSLKVALIQPNIGSLERMEAKFGVWEKVSHVVATYERLTNEAMKQKPDLVLWPEAGLPFNLAGPGYFSDRVQKAIEQWRTTFIVGAFATDPINPFRDYNAAFLFEPVANSPWKRDLYYKNILLAFGEYLPLGGTFPKLYRMFPQVSNFARGQKQNNFELSSGIRLGVTICYEAIVPAFVRKVAAHRIQALVNLTNDSWFGPTAEPYLHGALSVFRAIEYRVPLFRVTNTGTSFIVSPRGEISPMTPVYQEATLIREVEIPLTPPETFYLRFGDWFIALCTTGLLFSLVLLFRKRYATIPL